MIANPSGSFPLNDDWNYARTVKSLLEEHKLIITQWSLAASLTHTIIGYLVCLPFGFSFETLRISTAFLGLAAALSSYFLCLATGARKSVCALLAALLLVNPLFFNLSLSFMTDVPFLAFAAVLLLILSRLDQNAPNPKLLTAACLVASATCLLRQTGLVIPLGFFLVCLFRRKNEVPTGKRSPVRTALYALAPLLVATSAVVLFQLWLGLTAGTLYSYRVEQVYLQQVFSKGPLFVTLVAAAHAIDALVYLGIFALPAMPVIFPKFLSVLDKPQRFFAIALALECGFLLAVGLLMTGSAMPLVDNVFFNFGLGPLLVGETHLPKTGWPEASKALMVNLGLVGAAGAGFLCSVIIVMLMRRRKGQLQFSTALTDPLLSLCLTAGALYLTIICVRGFFDRYLLFTFLLALPVLAAACAQVAPEQTEQQDGSNQASDERREPKPLNLSMFFLSALLAAPLAYFSVAATHDYFEWNRARWAALRKLTEQSSISALDIDGGLEFNGWSAYEPRYRKSGIVFNTAMTHNNAYLIAFTPVPGFEVVEKIAFSRWLPPGKADILVLKKNPN